MTRSAGDSAGERTESAASERGAVALLVALGGGLLVAGALVVAVAVADLTISAARAQLAADAAALAAMQESPLVGGSGTPERTAARVAEANDAHLDACCTNTARPWPHGVRVEVSVTPRLRAVRAVAGELRAEAAAGATLRGAP